MKGFICPRCGNKDEKSIGERNGITYCRLCITYNGKEAIRHKSTSEKVNLSINYSLSFEQNEISEALLKNYLNSKDSLVFAVCGAGKTELVFNTILYVLKNGGKVGFAIPRREVVIELFDRLSSAFQGASIKSVYGGHCDELDGDLIVLTTHQLYRFPRYFDLLILDEIDAFPYAGNAVLHSFFLRSIKGNYILMSATPSDELLSLFQNDSNKSLLTLMRRYHGGLLPVPTVFICADFIAIIKIIKIVKRYIIEQKPVFIFCPTISICTKLYRILRLFLKRGDCVHSKKVNKELIIKQFKNRSLDFLVTTSVLERGVTVKNLQVIVFMASHKIFSASQLIQIAGRVGRKINYTKGEVLFFGKEKTPTIEASINCIKKANESVQSLF